ncbi:MAG: hypothetical protein IBJ00_05595 [Alphaproteobacteria bacterium]|nr:hypothetical protein [Alphaproteobacteria bacterium]
MKFHQDVKLLRPDSKGRLSLGALAKDISSFKVRVDKETHEIVLTPYTEIPFKEKWLFENETAMKSVKTGLKQSLKGEVKDRGSFREQVKNA